MKNMNYPEEYIRLNDFQRYEAKNILKEFSHLIQLRQDGQDSLIDIGSGSGDVLMDFVYPILPKTCRKVVGIDISPKMSQYCKTNYAEYDKVEFKILDIGTENLPLEYHEQFDHVTSFYCLHWVPNQRQALENIFRMLAENGDCLFLISQSHPVFDFYEILAVDTKWSDYMKDVSQFVPPTRSWIDPQQSYTELLRDVGFAKSVVEVRRSSYVYTKFRDLLRTVDPFVNRLPLSKQDEYMDDLCAHFKDFIVPDGRAETEDCSYKMSYENIIVYAKKN